MRWTSAAFIFAALAAGLHAQENDAPAAAPSVAEAIGREIRALFDRSRKAIVRIEAVDRHGHLSGSGFFIDPNGTLYTSYTIGGESRDIVVCDGTMKYPARRLVADARSGVAILKVDTGAASFLAVGKSTELELASPVVAIGYPMGVLPSPSFGTIGGFDLKHLNRMFATTHIRANVPVQRGEGGAPLLNMRGEVVGITIASVDSGGARFALPIEAAEKVRRDYMRFGEVRPGWIGIAVGLGEGTINGSTVRIEDLLAEGPAKDSGAEVGDILLRIGDRTITRPEDVIDASYFLTAEDAVQVKVARAGEEHEFTIETIQHPSLPPSSQHRAAAPPAPFDGSDLRGGIPVRIEP